MRRLFSSLFLICFLYLAVFPQSKDSALCPKLEITFPSGGYLGRGEPYYITAGIDGYDSEKSKYNWTLSADSDDVPFTGQGFPVISFVAAENLNGSKVIASLEIEGFPKNCENKISQSFQILFNPGTPTTLGDYGRMIFSNEKAELDNIVAKLKTQGDSTENLVLYFITYLSKSSTKTEQLLTNRETKIRNYLMQKHSISKGNIIFIRGEDKKYRTKVYVIPAQKK